MTLEEERLRAAELRAQGLNQPEIANAMGLSRHAVQRRLYAYDKAQRIDPAIRMGMAAVGTNMEPRLVWAKTKNDDGTSYSVLLRPEVDNSSVHDAIAEAMSNIPAVDPVAPPAVSMDDLMTVYTLADVHIGMMAWGRECGEDYDTNIATQRVKDWVGRCIAQSPQSKEAIILDVGDLTHADDTTNRTPASGHVLDVDTRHFRTIDMTIQAIAFSVDIALRHHEIVRVRIMRGNHNPHAYIAIMFALAERYRNEPRVDVIKDPADFFAHTWGRVMLAAHHGDRAKAQGLVLHMADAFPEMWGATRWRYLFSGHLHHHKSQDIGGVTWEQLRAVTSKDAYAAGYPFSARSEMQAITYHKERGEVSRVRVSNYD